MKMTKEGGMKQYELDYMFAFQSTMSLKNKKVAEYSKGDFNDETYQARQNELPYAGTVHCSVERRKPVPQDSERPVHASQHTALV